MRIRYPRKRNDRTFSPISGTVKVRLMSEGPLALFFRRLDSSAGVRDDDEPCMSRENSHNRLQEDHYDESSYARKLLRI